MRRTRAFVAVICLSSVAALTACSSGGSREDQLKVAKELGGAAEKIVVDRHKLLDALTVEEAWIDGVAAAPAKIEAAAPEKRKKTIAARHALAELRAACLELRVAAARLWALGRSLEDPNVEEEDVEDLGDEIPRLRLELVALKHAERLAEKRWQEARAALAKEVGEPSPPK
ncbi:hypothetical protein HY251_12820 [bacterium]|nr:hypothetical protein [bacterium]